MNCQFDIAWVGTCKKEVADGSDVCEEHAKLKCRCGKQAIRNCENTVGPLICGTLTCGKCKHSCYRLF